MRIKVKLKHKCAIKDAMLREEEEFNGQLADHLDRRDFNSF